MTRDCLLGVKIIIGQLTTAKRKPLAKCRLAIPSWRAETESTFKFKLQHTNVNCRCGSLYGCALFMQPVLSPSPKCSYMLNRSSCESVFRTWRQLPRGFDLPFVTHVGHHKPKGCCSTSILTFCALRSCGNISQRSVCVLFFPSQPLLHPLRSWLLTILELLMCSDHKNKPHPPSLSYHWPIDCRLLANQRDCSNCYF